MEYLSFGPMLERCRFFFLPELAHSRRALVLGDGDGRFLARLLAASPSLHAEAVDASPAMLRLLQARVAHLGMQVRLTTTCADARTFHPPAGPYDLIATHFFLDCLTESEAQDLVVRLRPRLTPGALWVVSEFQIPAGKPFQAWLARRIIAFLYSAFRLLTGLAVRQIPPWPTLLTRSGFTRKSSRTWLGGLLVSELWQAPLWQAPLWQAAQATASDSLLSHHAMSTIAEAPTLSGPNPIPGIDPGPEPFPGPPPVPTPDPAPGPAPEPDPEPYPGPIPTPQPVTRTGAWRERVHFYERSVSPQGPRN
jgi:hypothetical protein